MKMPPRLALLVFAIGVVLLIWGIQAAGPIAPMIADAFKPAPSDRSLALSFAGTLISAVGFVGLVRRP